MSQKWPWMVPHDSNTPGAALLPDPVSVLFHPDENTGKLIIVLLPRKISETTLPSRNLPCNEYCRRYTLKVNMPYTDDHPSPTRLRQIALVAEDLERAKYLLV